MELNTNAYTYCIWAACKFLKFIKIYVPKNVWMKSQCNNDTYLSQYCRKNNIFTDFYTLDFASHKLFIWI
jgi:hypothetical protein